MRSGTRYLAASALVAVALVNVGCGQDEETAPAACFGDADTYLTALESAPAEVRLDGATPISDCLVENQEGGELGQLGEVTIEVATSLNAQAQKDPGGDATLQLGYLVGAIQEGAAGTGGIHEDLIRRLDSAARFSEGGKSLGTDFEQAFGEGYAAGQESG